MTTSPAIALSYDASARLKRIWLRRLCYLLGFLVVAQVAWMVVGERVSNRILLLFWQRQCLNYSQPPGRLMYVWAPPGSPLPSHLGNFTPEWEKSSYLAGAMPSPIELAELQSQLSGRPAALFQQLAAPVYMHRLKDSKGNEKLVSVYVLGNNPQTWWTVCVVVHDLATITTDPSTPKLTTATWPMPVGPSRLLVLSGQEDPVDPSKFTIPVRINDQQCFVTGKLNADGTVEVTSSSGLDPADKKYTGKLIMPMKPEAHGSFLPTDD